jgi:hypothetical protein
MKQEYGRIVLESYIIDVKAIGVIAKEREHSFPS